MSARVRASLLALLALLAVVVPVAGVGPAAPSAATAASAQTATGQQTVPVDTTKITIALDTDGDAHWTITTRLNASNEHERAAFEELVESYRNEESEPPWISDVRAANDAAQRATGRPMTVTGVETASNATNATLHLSFTWTNFARETEDQFVVGDAFNTTDGTWMDGLTENQRLVIELPDGQYPVSAPPGSTVQNARISWEGPTRFEPGYMRIVYSGDAGPWYAFVLRAFGGNGLFVGGLLLGVVAVGAYFLRRHHRSPLVAARRALSTADDAETGRERDDGTSGQATAGTVEPDVGDDADGDADEIDAELLSDEERVERLLERNGGRMKQANIVTETQWSNAKVSQLLSAMEEEGRIDKLRIGRENLISFPDEDVADVDSN